jgi:hypothetical protein
MTLPDLYPAQVGSPYTTLAVPYATGETTMTVVDATKLPDAPNIVCLAGSVAGEFRYTGKDGNILQGVAALPGTPSATWPTGTYAFRGIAAYDHNALIEYAQMDRPKRGAYDVIVYKSGTSVIAEDATGATIASGTAGTDDTTVIQAAVDGTPTRGTLRFDGSEYTIDKTIRITDSINIRGSGTTITSADVLDNFITAEGTSSTEIPLTADVASAEIAVSITDASTLTAGQLVLIYDDAIWGEGVEYPNWKTGELHRIQSVSENTVTLYERITNAYTLGNNAKLIPISPISVSIRDLSLVGHSDVNGGRGIYCRYLADSEIVGCTLSKTALAAIEIHNSYNVSVKSCNISDCERAGYGYGISIADSSANITLSENCIMRCRHCITHTGYAIVGQCRDVLITNNILIGGSAGVLDAHPICERIFIIGNIIAPTIDGTSAIVAGAKYLTISGNMIHNGGVFMRGSIACESVVVTGNTYTGVSPFVFDTRFNGNRINQITVANNVARTAAKGVRIIGTTGTVIIKNNVISATANDGYGVDVSPIHCKQAIIQNNSILHSSRAAIRVKNATTFSITGNEICNPGQTSTDLSEIMELNRCDTGDVIGNHIYLVSNEASRPRKGILLTGTTDNVRIRDNRFDVTPTEGPCIDVGSATNVSIGNNIGYVTENSGAAATVADGGTIAHGCVKAPTKVTLTGSVAGEIVTVTSIDATNITVAIKKPDDSAGTAQTVYWRAEV